jgi:DMSO reductase anchor subunit
VLGDPADSTHISLLLAWRARQQTFLCRVVLSLISIVCAVAATVTVGSVCFCATIAALISAFATRVIGRYLFFVAAAAPKMPGSFSQ